MRHPFILYIFLILGLSSSGQDYFNLDVKGTAGLYSGSESPFWMHTNRRGRLDEKTFYSGLLSGTAIFEIDNTRSFQFGGGFQYKDGYDDGLKIDEAYFSYVSPKIRVDIGKRQRTDLYQGLSVSNESILWSLNASPFPGVSIETVEPIFFKFKDYGLGFKFSFGEYLLDDDRYIDNPRLHHKSGHLVYRSQKDFEVSLGLQQFVQWAGTSEEFGRLPQTLEDYGRVITGRAGIDDVGGQEVNALGNQIGSYELKMKSRINDLDVEFFYNHIFEDGSGLKLGNFPDGRYGIYVEDNRDTFWGKDWIKAFMYEFHFTKNQSRSRKSSLEDGADNYFNNNLYRSGWTYQNLIIGNPFILTTDERFRIGVNIITAHHVGITGKAFKLPYRALLSYRKNYGVKDSFFPVTKEVISSYLEVELMKGDYNLSAFIASDIKSVDQSNFGTGLKFSRSLF
ncbi:capsule assembly Wzi family protein [uncultured Christiangramia sp.]|uniref:capsule assembly Wzi family protein n=1 Tax=uncultured Christiangramia sp. TaxID=503836 RepID=UPI00261B584E|nr:capsule assembly Wzi family protein [uncultured Christiangramia sp.]